MSLVVTLTRPGQQPEDITGKLLGGTLTLGRSLGDEGASCSISLLDVAEPLPLARVLVTWNEVPLYRGQIINRDRENPRGSDTVIAKPKCSDAVQMLARRLVAEVYEERPAGEIVADLFEKYMPEVAVDSAQLQLVTTPLTFSFNYVALLECIRRIAEAAGTYWYLHPDGVLRFFQTFSGTQKEYSPKNIVDGSLSDRITASDFANRVWVFGAKQASPNYKTMVFSGDSSVFPLGYEPNYVQVRVDGVNKKVMLKENDDGTADFLVDKKAKLVTAKQEYPGAVIEVRFRPTVEIVDFFEDLASMRIYGIYEKAIRDRTITDKLTARQRGRAVLRQRSRPRANLSWQTRDWQVYPGQPVAVTYPSLEIEGIYRVSSVDTTFRNLGHRWDVVANITAEEV